jgi:hypothetical protein
MVMIHSWWTEHRLQQIRLSLSIKNGNIMFSTIFSRHAPNRLATMGGAAHLAMARGGWRTSELRVRTLGWCALFLVFAQMLVAGSALAQGAVRERSLLVPIPQQQELQGIRQQQRIALVIGNGAYHRAPLRNPLNDAQAMAATLGPLGFAVTKLENASKGQMLDAIRKFGDTIKNGGVGLFYFAGHGIQVNGKNFLLPVDADIQREDEVEAGGVNTNLVLGKMGTAKNSLNIVILDACRDNPFERSFRSAEQGLAPMEAPFGTLIAFSTAPGAVALDGADKHGLYTEHLLRNITEPGLKIEDVFKRTRFAVRYKTGGRQIPWENTSLEGDFFFVAPPTGTATPSGAATAEIAFWNSIKDSRSPAEFEAYLRRYPAGQFVDLARERQEALQSGRPGASSGSVGTGTTTETLTRQQGRFSFSREEERDRETRFTKDRELQARLSAPCPEPLRQRPIVIDIVEESRADGLVWTERSARFAQLLSQNLQKAGLVTNVARPQGPSGSLTFDLAGRSSVSSADVSRYKGSYSIQGMVFSQQGSNRLVRLKETSVSAELALRDPADRIITLVEVSGATFSSQDTSSSGRDLTKQQASDASSQLYTAFCSASVAPGRLGQ